MNRIWILVLLSGILFVLAACGGTASSVNQGSNESKTGMEVLTDACQGKTDCPALEDFSKSVTCTRCIATATAKADPTQTNVQLVSGRNLIPAQDSPIGYVR